MGSLSPLAMKTGNSSAATRSSAEWSGMPQVQTASYCASRVAQLVIASRSSVRAYIRPRASFPACWLAADRRVVTFDYAGVGGSTGETARTVEQMAHESIAFVEAMDLGQVDLLGFSIGSFVAQQIALTRPAIVRRVVLASAAPQGAAGMHGWAADVIGAIGEPQTSPEQYLDIFFTRSPASREAGQQALQRMYARTEDRDAETTWATRQAQYDAVCTWGIPDHALLQRLSCLQMPVFVANGDSDPMILPHYTYLLAGLIPQAQLKIYPDSAHGFLFQHHAEFAADVRAFLTDAGEPDRNTA